MLSMGESQKPFKGFENQQEIVKIEHLKTPQMISISSFLN